MAPIRSASQGGRLSRLVPFPPRLVICIDFGSIRSVVGYAIEGTMCDKRNWLVEVPTNMSYEADAESERLEMHPSAEADGVDTSTTTTPLRTKKAILHHGMKVMLDDRDARWKVDDRLCQFIALHGGSTTKTNITTPLLGNQNANATSLDPVYAANPDSVIRIIADFLSRLKKLAFKKLYQQYNKTFLYGLTAWDLVVTVPAPWDEYIKSRMMVALERSEWSRCLRRLRKISLVSEMTAGMAFFTIDCLRRMRNDREQTAKVGDCFIVVNGGGYRVTAQSFIVTHLSRTGGSEALCFEAATQADSDVNGQTAPGASSIELNFLRWLEQHIGKEAYEKIPSATLQRGSRFLEPFEKHKTEFKGRGRALLMTLPKQAQDPDSRTVLRISADQMARFFHDTISGITQLIVKQYWARKLDGLSTPKEVIVCGGLGANQHVNERLQKLVSDRHLPGVRCISSPNPPDASLHATMVGALCIATKAYGIRVD